MPPLASETRNRTEGEGRRGPVDALPVVRGLRLPQAAEAQPRRLPGVQLPLPAAGARAARAAARRGQLRGARAGHRPGRRARRSSTPSRTRRGSRRPSARPAAPRARSTARATIGGNPLVVAAMDFGFIGGSMGGGVGEAITRAAELALERREPLLVISASGGARMQEGCVSLMQMAKTSQALATAERGGRALHLAAHRPDLRRRHRVLRDARRRADRRAGRHIGFAGPKVIEQTIRQKLPDDFQTAEFLLEHGMLDLVEPRENLRRLAAQAPRPATRRAGDGGASRLPETEGAAPITDPDAAAGPRPVGGRPARPPHRPAERRSSTSATSSTTSRSSTATGSTSEDAAIVGGLAKLGELHRDGHRPPEGPHDAAR